ncbi:hypothetical protein [Bacillus bingmayongensis]|uniref:hypothetical protein n=1 Tax=Bacillus bingmayongensis TaxID=1150157 RepID=UPI0003094988|nr:hypothetical protein [Bacillus bingmayongensis]MBY0598577.1 hypothetical protein [Bacillus bingmayongensis]
MKLKKVITWTFAASLLFGGALPSVSHAEENEPVPFENVETDSQLTVTDTGSDLKEVIVYLNGNSNVYLGSNEIVGQSSSSSTSTLSYISVIGTIYKSGKYYDMNSKYRNGSRFVSVTNTAPFSSGLRYQQDGTHKFLTYSGKARTTFTSYGKTF